MSEEKSKDCLKCGADVRSGALFCYNCGSAVEVNINDSIGSNGNKTENVLTEQNIFKEKYTTNPLKTPKAIEMPVDLPLESPVAPQVEKRAKDREKKLAVQRETNLKTAASLRKKPKISEKKSVEVIWEAPENSSHTWFVLISLILVLFAVIMLMAMLYLR